MRYRAPRPSCPRIVLMITQRSTRLVYGHALTGRSAWLITTFCISLTALTLVMADQKEIDPYAFNAALSAPGVHYETIQNADGSVSFNIDPDSYPAMPHDAVVSLAESGTVSAQRYLGRQFSSSAREEDLAAAAKWFSLGAKQ